MRVNKKVESCMNAGFEFLVPALLANLEDEGLHFSFPGKRSLEALRGLKIAKLDPRMITRQQSTLLHSLEAFASDIDFNEVGQYMTFGSMMASPAATAAFLIHSFAWNLEAEVYLKRVVERSGGKERGGVPSVFPSPVFESTRVSHAS